MLLPGLPLSRWWHDSCRHQEGQRGGICVCLPRAGPV